MQALTVDIYIFEAARQGSSFRVSRVEPPCELTPRQARDIGCELVDMDKVADSYEVGQSFEWHSLRSLYGDLQPATV